MARSAVSGRVAQTSRYLLRDSPYALHLPATTDKVLVPHSTSLDITGAFSIFLWAKLTDRGNLVNKGGDTANGYKFSWLSSFFALVNCLAIRINAGLDVTALTRSMFLDQWYHIGVSFNGTSALFYRNAVLNRTQAAANPNSNSGVSLQIGGSAKGKFKDIVIYKGLGIPQAQVTSLYKGNPPDPTNLAAWWKCDEGSGTDLFDSSGNANTGVISGATSGYTEDTPYKPRVATTGRVTTKGYKRAITIDHNFVGTSDLTDFPVLISGTYSYLKKASIGGGVKNANGYDITFYADSNLTTLLKFERIFYDPTTGEVEFYVKVPSVSGSVDTTIYMAYGNESITTDQQDANNVWDSNYKLVHHLKDITTSTVNDSTVNAINGTKRLANNPLEVAGVGGKGQQFVAANADYIDFGTGNVLNLTDNFTIEIFVKLDAAGANKYIFNRRAAGGDQWAIIYGFVANKFEIYSDYAALRTALTTSVSDTTDKHHIAFTYTSTQVLGYLDGVLDKTNNVSTTVPTSSGALTRLGQNAGGGPPDAIFDELRVSSVVRSADWLLATNNNMLDPSSFYSVGASSIVGY